ncbi:MAG: YihY/virulence factor BrkB family protein [Gammaproteobacteria bacterium]|nr:YihY/virulence factor BrkB family protein [Gammaproteobacteria bacterium]
MFDLITTLKNFFTVSLWHDLPENSHFIVRWLHNALRVSYIVIRELAKGELNLRAMSLVFTTLLSLVPLIAVAFSVLKAFGAHNQIEPFLLHALEPLGAKGPEIAGNIIGFVENVKVGVLGSLGVTMLFYTIIALVQKIENAFNFVWRVTRPRTFARRFTDYLSVVLIGPLLVFTALGLAASAMNADLVQSLQAIEPFGSLILIISKTIPYLMIIIAFTFLYMFIPNTRVEMLSALLGAAVAGVLWITIGKIFASFVASSSNYTAIYSSFAILFFFMIWLYLGWLILLTGSQVAFYLQHPKLVRLGGKNYVLSPRLREKEGLWLMTVIARQFYQQKPAMTIAELEQKTRLDDANLQRLLSILQEHHFIAEIAGDHIAFQPAQDIAMITVNAILDCLRSAEESDLIVDISTADASINSVMNKLETSQLEQLDGMTLRQLAIGENQHA